MLKRYKPFRWVRSNQRTKTLSVRVPVELAEWLAERTRQEGVNVTEIVNRALETERYQTALSRAANGPWAAKSEFLGPG